jgi:hypothetical protein
MKQMKLHDITWFMQIPHNKYVIRADEKAEEAQFCVHEGVSEQGPEVNVWTYVRTRNTRRGWRKLHNKEL